MKLDSHFQQKFAIFYNSAWGHRVDDIRCTRAWYDQHKISGEEGLIAIGYERKTGSFSRVHQMAKNMLTGVSSGFYSCPVAAGDGGAMTPFFRVSFCRYRKAELTLCDNYFLLAKFFFGSLFRKTIFKLQLLTTK